MPSLIPLGASLLSSGQVGVVGLRFQPSREGFQRWTRVPQQPLGHGATLAKMIGANVYLYDRTTGRIEDAVGEIGSDHEQRVAILHRVIPSGRPDESRQTHPMGMVVFHHVRTLEGVNDGRLENLRYRNEFIACTAASAPREDRWLSGLIENFRSAIEIIFARKYF